MSIFGKRKNSSIVIEGDDISVRRGNVLTVNGVTYTVSGNNISFVNGNGVVNGKTIVSNDSVIPVIQYSFSLKSSEDISITREWIDDKVIVRILDF